MEIIILVVGKVETGNPRTKWKMFLPAFTVHAVIGKINNMNDKQGRAQGFASGLREVALGDVDPSHEGVVGSVPRGVYQLLPFW